MAIKNNIIIGLLLLTLISSGIVYVEWTNNARIRVDNDKTTFYVPHEDYPWMWVVSGREYNQLYDGTSLIYRDTKNIHVETSYDKDTITIKRTTPYLRGAVIIDNYFFDGKQTNIELFPIKHTVEVINATGKFYRYEVKDLTYNGATFKLDGEQTSQDFGKNMKVTWWEKYRLGWIYSSGSMYVKSEKLSNNSETFEVRLFDPVKYGYTLSLYLDGVNDSRKYEYYTTANITANITSCNPYPDDLCYQENATSISTCGALSTGTYEYNGSWLTGENVTDNNWSSYDLPIGEDKANYYWINYSKPNNAVRDGTLWEFLIGLEGVEDVQNVSIPTQCWANNPIQLRFYNFNPSFGFATNKAECWNGTDWGNGVSSSYLGVSYETLNVYEEAMNWNISDNECDLCVDIDDGITNLSNSMGDKNYSCGSNSVSFNYPIYILRQNEFNDSTTETNISSGNSTFILIDNMTDIIQFQFNLTNNGTFSENVTIDVDEDNVPEVNLLGKLTGANLLIDYFYSDNQKETKLNLTRSTAGTKTIYMNISTNGFSDDNPVENFTFRLDGFNIDGNNQFNKEENFSNTTLFSGTYNENISLFSAVEDFYNNDTIDWEVILNQSGGETLSIINPFTSNSYLQFQIPYFETENPNSRTNQMIEHLDNLDIRNASQISTNLTHYVYWANYPDAVMSYSDNIYLTDGTVSVALWTQTGYAGESSSGGGTTAIDLHLIRVSDTDINVYLGNSFSKTVSISSFDTSIRPYLKFSLAYSNAGGNGNRIFTSIFKLWNVSVSGISMKMDNSTYSLSPTNYTSDSLNITPDNIERATLTSNVYNPSNTTLTYYLSNDNQTTWEEVSNGVIHPFTSTGKNISARFQLETLNESISPIVYSYIVDISPSVVTNLSVDIGADGVTEWSYENPLNSSNSPQNFTENGTAVKDYIDTSCSEEQTCYIPISLSFGTAGNVQITEFNLTHNPNPINITSSLVEPFNLINLTFTYTDGLIQASNLILDYLGSKNITFLAHYWNDTSFNDSQIMQVKYSKFNVSLPNNTEYWEVFPKSNTQQNVTPYSQNNETPIWNVTSLAYDTPFDVYVKTNETLNSCLNITFTNSSVKGSLKLNTTSQLIGNDTIPLTGSFDVWNWVDLNNCSNRFEIPYFYWAAICTDCVLTEDFDETNLIET